MPVFVYAAAAAHLLLHLLTNGRYGIFRDEFYYLACADHLDWGYVDHPPLSILLLGFERGLFGDSVHAIRILPALAGAILVILGAALAKDLGGDRFAQTLAAVCVAIVPQYLVITGYFSMNAFDLLFWTAAVRIVVRIVKSDEPRWWLLLGLVLGLGLQNKVSVLFFGLGLGVALVFTPLRRHLARPQLWLGGLIALVLFTPHLVWQAAHDWPTLEFIRNATRHKIADLSAWQFVRAQADEIHPANVPVWLIGLGFLLGDREGRRFRALGIVYLTALVFMAAQRSKPYYLGPAYPMLLAAGGVALERLTARGAWTRLRPVLLGALLLAGAVVAPLVVPLLPAPQLVAYQQLLGLRPAAAEKHTLGALPQHFADRFGWEEMTRAVAETYASLSPEERATATILASNYGEAGALRYFGRAYGLPPAVSQHNNFYLWGPGSTGTGVVLTVGLAADDLRDAFLSVSEGQRFEAPYAMPYETKHPVLVCRGLKIPLREAWRRGKSFI